MIPDVLSEEEVDELNAAIDHMLPILDPQPHASMAFNAPQMYGEKNIHVKICRALNALRDGAHETSPAELREQFQAAGFPPQDADRDAKGRPKVADVDALREALAAATLGGAALSAEEQEAALEAAEPAEDGSIVVGVGRTDVSGMLSWVSSQLAPTLELRRPSDAGAWAAGEALLRSVPPAARQQERTALPQDRPRQRLQDGCAQRPLSSAFSKIPASAACAQTTART